MPRASDEESTDINASDDDDEDEDEEEEGQWSIKVYSGLYVRKTRPKQFAVLASRPNVIKWRLELCLGFQTQNWSVVRMYSDWAVLTLSVDIVAICDNFTLLLIIFKNWR
jgi:hypothetical protein